MDHDDLQPDDLDGPGIDEQPPGYDPVPEPVAPPVDPDDGQLDLPDLPDFEVPELPDLPDGPGGSDPPHLDEPIDLPDDLEHERPPEADPGEGVDLDFDQPLEPAGSVAGDATTDEVDLSLDPDDDLESSPAADADEPDVVDLPILDDQLAPFEVAEGNAWLSNGLIAAGLLAIGAAVPALARLRRATPPELAAHLDALGIDARVEHLDLTGLEELLRADRTVLLSTDGSAGVDVAAVLELTEVDRTTGRLLVVDGKGGRSSVDLGRFEVAWSDSANQVVVAAGDDGAVALVPVVLRPADLVTA